MNEQELRDQIEAMRVQLDELKEAQTRNETIQVDESVESDDSDTVTVEDASIDDPDGEIAATLAALQREIALMRGSVEETRERMERNASILRRQGFKA